jgi:hypothetical protein
MQIIDCEQGTEAWFKARAGIPTASEFHTVLAIGKNGGASLTRKTYLRKLAGEILTGEPMESYSNAHMERGKAMEDEARDLYSFMKDCEPQRVGFILNGQKGASPDSLIGNDGGLEIKSALAHIQIERLVADELPSEHKAQVQGCLWVAEREFWDFASYCPKLPLFIKRVYRDEAYIKKLAVEVDLFNIELQQLVEYVRQYGTERVAA